MSASSSGPDGPDFHPRKPKIPVWFGPEVLFEDSRGTRREYNERIKRVGKTSWLDWLAVGKACAIGKTAALKAAGTKACVGSRYNAAMSLWLRENGLDGIVARERWKLFKILENFDAIEAWRAGLDDAMRRKLNHPSGVWLGWHQTVKPRREGVGTRAATCEIEQRIANAGVTRSNHWPQSMLRRAADGMREARSNDLLILAKVALQYAIRNEGDIHELLGIGTSKPAVKRSGRPARHREPAQGMAAWPSI